MYGIRIVCAFVMLAPWLPASAADTLYVAGASERLFEADQTTFMQPVWSPDGEYIALTGARYDGIWVVRPDGSGLQQVTDEPAAGYGFQWSADGSALLARVARYEGPRRLNAVKLFDLDTDTERQLTDYRSSMPSLPRFAAQDDRALLSSGGKLEVFPTGIEPAAGKAENPRPVLVANESRIGRANLVTGTVQAVGPRLPAGVLNLSVSQDGSRVAFEVMGGNLYAMNADGSGLVDLGPGNRPEWSPDGAYVVYMVTADDGHQFTGSDLYAVRPDGTGRVRLTDTPERLEMNPSWSPDGRWVAFDDAVDGAIYLLPVAR